MKKGEKNGMLSVRLSIDIKHTPFHSLFQASNHIRVLPSIYTQHYFNFQSCLLGLNTSKIYSFQQDFFKTQKSPWEENRSLFCDIGEGKRGSGGEGG